MVHCGLGRGRGVTLATLAGGGKCGTSIEDKYYDGAMNIILWQARFGRVSRGVHRRTLSWGKRAPFVSMPADTLGCKALVFSLEQTF